MCRKVTRVRKVATAASNNPKASSCRISQRPSQEMMIATPATDPV